MSRPYLASRAGEGQGQTFKDYVQLLREWSPLVTGKVTEEFESRPQGHHEYALDMPRPEYSDDVLQKYRRCGSGIDRTDYSDRDSLMGISRRPIGNRFW
jgi:hypothetical protein